MAFLTENTHLNIALCLTFVLAIGQVLTAIALIILFKTYSKLKKKANECQKNLTELIEKQNFSTTVESEIKEKWEKQGEECHTRVPTPPSNRTSSSNFPRTQSNNSTEMPFFRDSSFASARSRDSGTGSITTRSQQNSISCDAKKLYTLSERNSREGGSRTISRDSQFSQSEGWRTSSTSSQGLERKSFGFKRGVHLPPENFEQPERAKNQNELLDRHSSRLQTMAIEMIGQEEEEKEEENYLTNEGRYKDREKNITNQNELLDRHSSRLQTMAIGMIGQEEEKEEDGGNGLTNEGRHKDGQKTTDRRSDIINQNELLDRHSSRLQTMAIGMIGQEENGLTNEGYHDGNEDNTTCSRSKNPTLASEELACELKSTSQQISTNPNTNLIGREEEMRKKWHKDGEDMPTKVPTPPSNRRSKRNQNEPQDSHSSRLQTMAIGMIGLEDDVLVGKSKSERASIQLNQSNQGVHEESSCVDSEELTTRL